MDPELQARLDEESAGLKFSDPSLQRPAAIAAGKRNLDLGRRRQIGKGKEALVEDRDNPELEVVIAADPTKFMRERLTKMMVRELAINDTLYSMTPPDHKAISESNKRLMDIGEALKALPNQTAGNGGANLSLAEAIQAAREAGAVARERKTEADTIYNKMMERSETAFGEDQ